MKNWLITLLLISAPTFADQLEVFVGEGQQVKGLSDTSRVESVKVFSLHSKEAATQEMNQWVQHYLRHNGMKGTVTDYRLAFSALQNSKDWPAIYKKLQQGSEAIGHAIQHGISKTPAVVINKKWVIYGIPSLDHAYSHYLALSNK